VATQLDIVNDILQRLREDTVAAVSTSDYSKLIGMFVNDAKEDLEDMWFWTVNETEISTSVLSDGTRTYDLTGTTDRSWLIRFIPDQRPMAYDTTTDENNRLQDISRKVLLDTRNMYRGTVPTLGAPNRFAIVPDSDGRGWTIELEQGSSTARTWKTYWYVPQAEFAVAGTDGATELKLPERPVFLRALYYALNERGEEMGEPGGVADERADRAAAAAMEIDTQVNKKSDEKDMTNLEQLRNGITEGYL